jgi:DNA-directed RNA polymerase subunit K/omega
MSSYTLTRFEKARIIGERARLISMGNPIMIDMNIFKSSDPIEIATEELNQHKLPLIIIRTFPNGEKQEIKLHS